MNFPYGDLVAENARRGKLEPEYELVDTGIFDDGRYWVVTVDYAKAGARDLLMQITVENAGPDEATIDVLPTLWFRNTWSWGYPEHEKPNLRWANNRIVGAHSKSGPMVLIGDGAPEALFCENETNNERLFGVAGGSPVPQGRHQRPRGLRRGDREPGSDRHQGGAAVLGDRAGRRVPGDQGTDGR